MPIEMSYALTVILCSIAAKLALPNWERGHRGSKACSKNLVKYEKGKHARKDGLITQMFSKLKAPLVPPTVSAPPIIQSIASSSDGALQTPKRYEADAATSIPTGPCPIAMEYVNKLELRMQRLPSSIPKGIASDVMAQFAINPSQFSEEEAWEMTDKMMN